jgi:hypothetical protein
MTCADNDSSRQASISRAELALGALDACLQPADVVAARTARPGGNQA